VPRVRSGFESVKDAILCGAGLALGAYSVTHPPDSEWLMAISVGLCVAPAALLPGKRGK
jgi:hypothetical protein